LHSHLSFSPPERASIARRQLLRAVLSVVKAADSGENPHRCAPETRSRATSVRATSWSSMSARRSGDERAAGSSRTASDLVQQRQGNGRLLAAAGL